MRARRTLRAVGPLLRIGFASALAYRAEFLVWILTTNMPLVMLALWTSVARDAPIGRFTEKTFIAYFLATLIVRMLTSSWVVWQMNFEAREGLLAIRVLRPIHPFVTYALDNLAAIPMRALVALPVAVVALAIVGKGALTHDPVQWLLVLPSLAGAWLILFAIMAAIGAVSLHWEKSLSVFDLYLALSFSLSGYTIPIELFPPLLRRIANVLPFRYTLSYPVENLLAMTDRAGSIKGLVAQWAWALLALWVANTIWRRGTERYSAYGG